MTKENSGSLAGSTSSNANEFKKTNSYLDELQKHGLVILGAGVSGKAIAQMAYSFNIPFKLVDEKSDITKIEINGYGETLSLTVENSFLNCNEDSIVVVSPGWKPSHQFVQEARQKFRAVIGEVDFAWRIKNELNPNQKWLAITGTNGKTTTVQMLASILRSSDINAIACGNVGVAVITAVIDKSNYDVLAIELSSFQIEWMREAKFESVAILNIAPDHIDWHESFENYVDTKLSLLSHSKVAILNKDDTALKNLSPDKLNKYNSLRKIITFSLYPPLIGEIGIIDDLVVDRAFISNPNQAGAISELVNIQPLVPHNVANAMAASGVAMSISDAIEFDSGSANTAANEKDKVNSNRVLKITYESIAKGLKEFKLDRHRLELVTKVNDISWINDSKATNPHAATAALRSFFSIIWLAGGVAKGASMDDLIIDMGARVKTAILFGQDREIIAAALHKYQPQIPIIRISVAEKSAVLMELIVKAALEVAMPGDTVLLAPACASMDQFKSYADRGNCFIDAVNEIILSSSNLENI